MLASSTKLLELFLNTRKLPILSEQLSGGADSAANFFADLEGFAIKRFAKNKKTYQVGLDMEWVGGRASRMKIEDTLQYSNIPRTVCRFIGDWLARKTFRVRSNSYIGVVYNSGHVPNGGVLNGGVISLLLWPLRVHRKLQKTYALTESRSSRLRLRQHFPQVLFSQLCSVEIATQLRYCRGPYESTRYARSRGPYESTRYTLELPFTWNRPYAGIVSATMQ